MKYRDEQGSNLTPADVDANFREVVAGIAARIPTAQIGAANGVAPLDSGGKVASAYLPSFVDDVLEFANLAAFPATGESGKIYVALDSNKTYRWGGSSYVEISASPGSTDVVPEGTTNLYHTASRVRTVVLTGLSLADSTVVAATDSVLQAIGKLGARLATAFSRANHTGTQPASTISDLTEVTQDVVGAMIVAGSNVSVTYDDVAGALTISASGGGGSVVGACQAAFDGGGSDVAVGSACEIRMPYAMTISKVTVLGDAAGSISVDVRVDSLANYPPLAGDSIVGASPPQLSGSASSEDSTLSGWTTAIAAGSVLRFVVSACSGIGRATVIIEGVRS